MREQAKKEDGLLVRLAKQAESDAEQWFGDTPCSKSIPHHTLALVGQVGSFASLVKKIERGDLSIGDAAVRYNLAVELTDSFTEMLNLAALLHIDLEESYKYVRAANKKRHLEERSRRENNGRRTG